MALSKWLMRKSFDEAADKAEIIRTAAQFKRNKNSGLFTASQENLRRELGLGIRAAKKEHVCSKCGEIRTQMKPSRSHLRVRMRNT